ncbi:unnamed protein product [Heterobilharzia americana]|nr:unnamed protein product [Heterobilharzia americana]
MDPEKFLNLQVQMRENNMEVADFLSDFTAWKQTVESKSKRLENLSQPEIPAIRNSLFKKSKKKRNKQKISDKKVERIKAYDYRAWDKFDVDKALEEDDKDGSGGDKASDGHSCSSETDEEQEDERRIQLSKEARELGNVRFKEGRLDEAIEQYTMAIRLAPEDPIPYTNRAFAYIKTERFASAETDCTAALKLDKTSVKALFRRALARKGLGQISGAIEDLEELLKINSDNKSALSELNSLTGRKMVNTSNSSTSHCSIQSTSNQRKMRRIPIVEISGDIEETQKTKISDCTYQTVNDNCPIKKKDDVTEEKIFHSTSLMLNTSKTSRISSSDSKNDTSKSVKMINNPVINSTGDHLLKKSEPFRNINLHKPPSNWFQLEREVRELCQRDSSSSFSSNCKTINLSKEAIIYLCNIQPNRYAELFGENMESDFLSRMLQSFCQSVNDTNQLTNHEIADRLLSLSKLPRFDVAWMMTNETERLNVIKLIKLLQNDNSINKELIKQISVQFECDI